MVKKDGRNARFMVEIDGLLHRLQVKLYAGSAQEVKRFASHQTFAVFSCKSCPCISTLNPTKALSLRAFLV